MQLEQYRGTIGPILKGRREEVSLSQRQLAEMIDFKNSNFISMIESGRSMVPGPRINMLGEALDLDNAFLLAIVATVYPDWFDSLHEVFRKNKDVLQDTPEKTKEMLADKIEEMKKHYKV